MKYNELTISKSRKTKRVGRGIASGQGKTAGRGTKGQGARKSGNVRPGFEGGQTPLAMRLPKLRGFTSKRVKVQEVYTSQLEKLGAKSVDTLILFEKGLVGNAFNPVKLLFDTEMTKPVSIRLQSASAAAIAAVQKAGGSFERIARLKHTAVSKEV